MNVRDQINLRIQNLETVLPSMVAQNHPLLIAVIEDICASIEESCQPVDQDLFITRIRSMLTHVGLLPSEFMPSRKVPPILTEPVLDPSKFE